jgi:hypothetical protein
MNYDEKILDEILGLRNKKGTEMIHSKRRIEMNRDEMITKWKKREPNVRGGF